MKTAILTWAEVANGRISSNSLELLSLARSLADSLDGRLASVLLGQQDNELAATLIRSGVDQVYFLTEVADDFYPDRALADMTGAIEQIDPHLILLPHSDYGVELAPRLAFRLQSATAMGCVEGRVEDGRLKLTRTCYGGKARALVSFRSELGVATIRSKCFDVPEQDSAREGEITIMSGACAPTAPLTKLVSRHTNSADGVNLEDATVVVAGGQGLGGADAFELLETFADLLGGTVGASRPACDLGWYPQDRQVGISGITIAPELYIAVGISGADHHMAGCGRAKLIVAINNDPDAAIFSHAHVGVVADFESVIPEVVDLLQSPPGQDG